MDLAFVAAALLSGVAIGFVLGLVGGGGSVLATPLLLYVVGVDSPHVAIGTGAAAVAANAAAGLVAHARAETVKWPCALTFGGAGVLGAFAGSSLGKAIDGSTLLAAFGLAMIAIGGLMLAPAKAAADPDVALTRDTARRLLPRLLPFGFGAGAASGFFGIGGGFLIAPGLMAATRMPMAAAVGTSLVAVTAFGATTAVNYAAAGLVDAPALALLIAGGLLGAVAGQRASAALASRKRMLTQVLAGLVIVVGGYVVARGLGAL